MKKYLLILMLLPISAMAQIKTATRSHNGYTVTYTYDMSKPQWIWEGVGKKLYYAATIRVSSPTGRIGADRIGLYRPEGGYKDSARIMVNKARNISQ